MPRQTAATVADLLALLGDGDPVPAGVLVEQLGVSRPVLARLVAEAGERILRLGKARATHYAARATAGTSNAWPLFRMRADATLQELGTLHALRGDRFHFQPSGESPNLTRSVDTVSGYFPGLPWFLDDLRPQGFLGRTLAHRMGRQLGVPEDLTRWQVRDTLTAILHGGTGMGDLLLGQFAVERALAELDTPTDAVTPAQRAQRYPAWAREALAGEEIGSSPGGEQPKFTATVDTGRSRYAALVKFAPPDEGQAARRWAELLACEHLALNCLRDAGLDAAESELIQTDGHTFLEVRRFDRMPGTLGRRGFVSLLALDAAFIGDGTRDWGLAGEQLLAARWIERGTADTMARLHWFGRFIGNSDMHLGNLGFHLPDTGPLPLCPAYDMLPMYLAPSRTGIVRPAGPLPLAAPARGGQLPHIAWAADAALRFWQAVADSHHITSPELNQLAGENHAAVATFARRFAG